MSDSPGTWTRHRQMLRTRLLLHLLPFPVILLGVGAYALFLLERLARELDQALTVHYQNVASAQEMTTCLARIQAAIRLGIDADPAEAAAVFQRQVSLFEQHLARQRADNQPHRQRPLVDDLTQSFRALHASGATTLLEPDRSDRRRDYDQRFYPASLKIQLLLDELEQSGRRGILNAHQTAGRALRQVTTLMGAAILLGLLLSIGSGYRLARSIVAPIQALTRAARNLGQGDPTAPVQVTTRDELAALASAFNEMAGQLERFRQSTSNEILRLHRTLQATLASFPDPVYVLGPNGAVELENLAATALPQNLGAAGTLPAPLDALVAHARASGASHLPSDFSEVICVRQESQDRFYLPRVVVMRDAEGGLVGITAVLHDVTRFRLLDAVKTNLVSTVSHELKTPLTGLRMALHLLADESLGPLNPRQLDMAATARDDAERLLRILNDLLDLTRLDAGADGLRRECLTVQALFQEVVADLAPVIASARLRFSSELGPELPAVSADLLRIRHVFANLVGNAIKHSPPNGRIHLRAARTGVGHVEFSVRDDGPGIPSEYHQRVFERFFRLPGQSQSGAGLGLSIAREIVLAHGGYLGIRNPPGHGAEFFFTVPLADETHVEPQPTTP